MYAREVPMPLIKAWLPVIITLHIKQQLSLLQTVSLALSGSVIYGMPKTFFRS